MQRYKVRGEWSDPPFLTIGFAEMVMWDDCACLLASHKKLVEALEKAAKLARRTAWIAYVWNDHNFEDAYIEARRECKEHGIDSFEAANDYLESVDAALAMVSAIRDPREAQAEIDKLKEIVREYRREHITDHHGCKHDLETNYDDRCATCHKADEVLHD